MTKTGHRRQLPQLARIGTIVDAWKRAQELRLNNQALTEACGE